MGSEQPSFEEDAGRAEKVQDGGVGPAAAGLAVRPPGALVLDVNNKSSVDAQGARKVTLGRGGGLGAGLE